MKLYPLKFEPVYKDYPWGNTRLPSRFNREAPEGVYAESWEISTHPDGESVITNGELAGKKLSEVIAAQGADLLGSVVAGNDFPLLIKLLDPARPLSVQVHPNNKNAAKVQGDAKTEAWYFLNVAPAQVYCGLKPGTTRSNFEAAITQDTVADLLQTISAKKGDAIFVPGGRVHAIDTGCLILEVQQNSNTTYRVYDWGRKGNDGQPRELNVKKALQVIDFDDTSDPRCESKVLSDEVKNICTAPCFVLNELCVNGSMQLVADGRSFQVLFCADGAMELMFGNGEMERIPLGTSVLIPAALGPYAINSAEPLTVVQVMMPL